MGRLFPPGPLVRAAAPVARPGRPDPVVPGAVGLHSGARAWWVLRAMGFDRAAVLDGGLPAWTAAGAHARIGEPAAFHRGAGGRRDAAGGRAEGPPRSGGRAARTPRVRLWIGGHRVRARLAADRAGYRDLAVHDGSWSERGQPSDRPVARGAARARSGRTHGRTRPGIIRRAGAAARRGVQHRVRGSRTPRPDRSAGPGMPIGPTGGAPHMCDAGAGRPTGPPQSFGSEQEQLGEGGRESLLTGSEIDHDRDLAVAFDLRDPAEAVLVVAHPVSGGESLRRRRSRSSERAGGEMAPGRS
ncbi:hypothetical protein KNE206_50340 [Kitasatospora sp. NE20-6]